MFKEEDLKVTEMYLSLLPPLENYIIQEKMSNGLPLRPMTTQTLSK